MKLIKDIYNFLIGEQSEPKLASRPRSIANAIKKRNPVSFFYNGPRGKVQPGRRIKAEMVALGISKSGKMIVRAWVEPPSRSKTGFEKNNWRTFLLSRMSQIEIFDQETFDQKRPGYKEGNDNSMTVTYVTSDWTSTPEPQPQQEPQPMDTEPTPQQEPPTPQEPQPDDQDTDTQPQTVDLPQPEPDNTPSIEPPKGDDRDNDQDDDEDGEDNNYDGLNESIKRIKELLYN